MLMDLAETPFTAIQGEGHYAGVLSFFIRFSGCNLRCQWNNSRCDTPYASYNPEHNDYTVQEVLDLFYRSGCQHIVITGGEPLLEKNIGAIKEIRKKTPSSQITIETNGTQPFIGNDYFYSISPKIGTAQNLNNRDQIYFTDLESSPSTGQVKIVIDGDMHESTLDTLLARYDRLISYLMPAGITPEQINANAVRCIKLIEDRPNVYYSDRLHIRIFGDMRGT